MPGPNFEYLAEYRLVICTQCHYAVWPGQLTSHLQAGPHWMKQKEAQATAADLMQQWPGLCLGPDELIVPSAVRTPLEQLPVHPNGMQCQLQPQSCSYVCCSLLTMKRHWRKKHKSWSVGGSQQGGGSGPAKAARIARRMEQALKPVHCQQLFAQGRGSQYFAVSVGQGLQDCQASLGPLVELSQEGNKGRSMQDLWSQITMQATGCWQVLQDRTHSAIQEGTATEVSPWLERTGWLQYLEGLDRQELLASIQMPGDNRERQEQQQLVEQQQNEEEVVEEAIWAAMDGLVRHCHKTIESRVGVFIRMEAIRTEKHQTRYQPLKPYMDAKALGGYSRPWKQVLVFIARTQRRHTWRSPQYGLSMRQQRAWERLVAEADQQGQEEEVEQEGEPEEEAKLTGVQRACLEFCITLLDQQVAAHEYESALVCAIAVLGVDKTGWKGADSYPSILSAMIKIARFLVVEQALGYANSHSTTLAVVGQGGDQEDSLSENSSSETSESSPSSPGCLQRLKDMMDRFMVRGTHGPIQWMLDLRSYGMKIAFNTTSPGHIDWVGDQVLYKATQFTMADFRQMLHGLVTETKRLLVEDLLCSSSSPSGLPQIPWNSIRDNPTEGQPAWNFMQDQRCQWPASGEKWLFEKIAQDPALQQKFVSRRAALGLKATSMDTYMAQVVEFREKLLVLMHMTGGQPARAPEILSIRHSNTAKGEHRNVFVEDGMVVFVTRYHKGYAASGDVKIIHRYLPQAVGELLVWYLWLVLPFQQQIEALIYAPRAVSFHLWPADPKGKRWTSERMRKVIRRETMAGLGQPLTIQSYRDIAIGISRKYVRGKQAFQMDEEDEDGDWNEDDGAAIADEQAGHSSHVAGMVYARGIMEGCGVVASKRQKFREASTAWHRFLGFLPSLEDNAAAGRKRGWGPEPFETEAEQGRMQRWKRLRTAKVNEELQRLYGDRAQFRGVQKAALQAIMAGESPVVTVMPTGGGKSLLFMLPAAIGARDGGTTVVVVPLIALREDLMQRCEKIGIRSVEWNSRRPADGAAVVLVTPESAVSDSFTTYLNRLKAMRQLDRIVIDECHVVLNRKFNFRKEMQALGRLIGAETQMVLLTATLPLSMEPELWGRMGWSVEEVKLFRDSTARKNVRYSVIDIPLEMGPAETAGRQGTTRQREEEFVVEWIRQRQGQLEGTGGKIIVYCNTVGKVKRLAEELDCPAYHHHQQGKKVLLAELVDGQHPVVVATSALGMGIDIPDIRTILHVDQPRNLLDYAQESGRAGRDGKVSEAVTMLGRARDRAKAREEGKNEEEEGWRVAQYLFGGEGGAGCRRVVLDSFLDGSSRVECQDGEEACDICQRERGEGLNSHVGVAGEEEGEAQSQTATEVNLSTQEEGLTPEEEAEYWRQQRERRQPVQRQLLQASQLGHNLEELVRQLHKWKTQCAICLAAGYQADNHTLGCCQRPESLSAREECSTIGRNIKFAKFSGCFWCGLPQSMCSRWEQKEQGGRWQQVTGGECEYKGVLLAGLMGIGIAFEGQVGDQYLARLRDKGVRREGVDWWTQFLGEKKEEGGVESNNLVWEFLWMARQIE